MDVVQFLTVFGTIFLAELPDKSMLTTIVLASRQDVRGVFLGAAAALILHSLIAVTIGTLLLKFLPRQWVQIAAAVLFLIFAVLSLRGENEDAEEMPPGSDQPPKRFWASVAAGFGLIFLAEWGDMTQLAAMSFTAKYGAPKTVFAAAALAECSASALGIGLGAVLKKKLPRKLLQKLSAAVFAAVGIYLIASL